MAWRPAKLIPRILQGKPPYMILRHMWTGVGPQSLSYPEKNQGNRRECLRALCCLVKFTNFLVLPKEDNILHIGSTCVREDYNLKLV